MDVNSARVKEAQKTPSAEAEDLLMARTKLPAPDGVTHLYLFLSLWR